MEPPLRFPSPCFLLLSCVASSRGECGTGTIVGLDGGRAFSCADVCSCGHDLNVSAHSMLETKALRLTPAQWRAATPADLSGEAGNGACLLPFPSLPLPFRLCPRASLPARTRRCATRCYPALPALYSPARAFPSPCHDPSCAVRTRFLSRAARAKSEFTAHSMQLSRGVEHPPS